MLHLLLAMSEGHGEYTSQIAIKVGQPRREFGQAEFSRRISEIVGQQKTATVEEMQVGSLRLEVTRCAAECQIRVPSELTMLGKTLLNLDQVGRTLAPQFDPNASIRRNAAEILRQRVVKTLSPGNLFTGV